MNVDSLRISVTDRCNLQCLYCRPLGDCDFFDHDEILSFEEIHRIVTILARRGLTKIRLTGGEPLVRKDITELIAMLSAVDGITDIALTTNGVLLESMAGQLKAAGLARVNISLDSIDRDDYKAITGADRLPNVIRAVKKAIEVDLTPVKINAVILKGINDTNIPDLAAMSIDLPVIVRFIEYCPTEKNTAASDDFIPNSTVRKTIERTFGPLADTVIGYGGGPASYAKIPNSAGALGFIAGRTSFFCQSCKRLRLTSDGRIRPCLYSSGDFDIKTPLRNNATDQQLDKLLTEAINRKAGLNRLNSIDRDFSMRKIGG